MGDTLAGQTVALFGSQKDLNLWPTIVLGMTSGGLAVPLAVGSDGTLAVTTETVASITDVKSTALEASHVLKAAAGKLVSLTVFNSKASAQFILVMNSATVPADGAVTLLFPPIPIAAASIVNIDLPVPVTASTGISVCNSSTGSFTKTIGSADCCFFAQVI